jgi:peptidoglycan/xylan/chitin deacetylase (PgdA/CDA1 family)
MQRQPSHAPWSRLVAVGLCAVLVACTAPATTPQPTAPTAAPSVTPVPSVTPTPQAQSTMPSPTPTGAPATPTTAPPTPAPTPGPTVVAVVRGDTLSLIAGRHDTTWGSLVYWNMERYPTLDPASPGYDPNRIEVGWELTVWPGVVVDYTPPLPTPTPPPATPRPTAAPTPPTGTTSVLVSHGNRSSGSVALTFDMGGRVEPAVAIMTWLRDHGVPATIFMTGASVDTTTAARQVLSMIDARPDLFDLGNHSYSHPDMTKLTVAQVTDELRRAETAIDAHAVQSPRPLFRPPYGAWNAGVLAGAGAAGYRWSVMWDVDTLDWKPISDGGPTASQIVAKVLQRAQGGSIVLMHLGGYETLDALPGIVSGLQSRGFRLVTLGTMLGD